MARSAWRSVLAGIGATVVVFAGIEGALRIAYFGRARFVEAVPLPYRIGGDYGPTPPWIDSTRMLEPDERLLWHNRGGFQGRYLALFLPFADDDSRLRLLRRFSPILPASPRDTPRWDVQLDSRGFRDGEFSAPKMPGAVRNPCLRASPAFRAHV